MDEAPESSQIRSTFESTRGWVATLAPWLVTACALHALAFSEIRSSEALQERQGCNTGLGIAIQMLGQPRSQCTAPVPVATDLTPTNGAIESALTEFDRTVREHQEAAKRVLAYLPMVETLEVSGAGVGRDVTEGERRILNDFSELLATVLHSHQCRDGAASEETDGYEVAETPSGQTPWALAASGRDWDYGDSRHRLEQEGGTEEIHSSRKSK